MYKEQSHEFLRGRVTLETKPRLHSPRVLPSSRRFRSHFAPPSNRPSSFDGSTIFLSSASRGVSFALSFFLKRKLRSFVLFLSSCPFLILVSFLSSLSTQVSRISTCGVVRNHQDYYDARPRGHGSSLSSDSDLRQLEHGRSITLLISLEPFHRPFHFASTPETSEVGDPQSNAQILFQY